jgi:hypothetical protein
MGFSGTLKKSSDISSAMKTSEFRSREMLIGEYNSIQRVRISAIRPGNCGAG